MVLSVKKTLLHVELWLTLIRMLQVSVCQSLFDTCASFNEITFSFPTNEIPQRLKIGSLTDRDSTLLNSQRQHCITIDTLVLG